jgi:alpha-1,2-mannosyltransferase
VSEPDPPRPRAIDWPTHLRRAVWVVWGLVMIGAAVAYAWKAADSRSAFVRWRHQILELPAGVNIWDKYYFPNPPILPLMLYPLMVLPPMAGALAWFVLKVAMTAWCTRTLLRMVRGHDDRPIQWFGLALVLLLSLRPILSDLQHGNINILILFLIVASLAAWRRGRDGWAGMALGLAIATKVTPALFVPYFLYKRSWRMAASSLAGVALFLLVVPSVVLGPAFNMKCLLEWREHIISPFVEGPVIHSMQEVNQSMVGVLTRLLTESGEVGLHGYGGTELDLNVLAINRERAALAIKTLAVGLVLLGAALCRTKIARRDDPRMLGEFALVVLTMLFVSERSWKHHYVTILLPLVYLVYRMCRAPLSVAARAGLAGALALSASLMATTSSEVGGLFADGKGDQIALFFGLYFWSGVVLYLATARRVVVERDRPHGPPASISAPHVSAAVERPTLA